MDDAGYGGMTKIIDKFQNNEIAAIGKIKQ